MIVYEVIPAEKSEVCRELCNELMTFQKSKAIIYPEMFDSMSYETRMVPSISSALHNYIVLVKDENKSLGYVYCNISPKEAYSNSFATFFDMNSVKKPNVGCLSQFYIKDEYRKIGIGSTLINMAIKWLSEFKDVDDYFVYVSNGNDDALEFYQKKGFIYSHKILDGFISVLRNKSQKL